MRTLLHSWRTLRVAPAHAIGVLSSVTVGLTLSLLAWHVVIGLTYGDLPGLRERHRLARLHLEHTGTTASESIAGRRVGSAPWSPADVDALAAAQVPGVVGIGAEAITSATVRVGGATLRQSVAHITGDYFDTFGTEPSQGRLFTAAERDANVAVLGWGLWTALQQPADIIGRVLTVDDVPYTIVGVAPADFGGLRIRDIGDGPLDGPQVWIPLTTPRPLQTFVRLEAGTFASGIGAVMAPLAKGLEAATPGARPGLAIVGQSIGLDPAERPGAAIAAIALFMTLPLAVLGLAMINVVNLQLARLADAMHAVRVRLSLGATPAQATAWLLGEVLLLSTISAGLALAAVHVLVTTLRPYAPFIALVSTQAFVVAGLLTLLVAVFAGWVPAWVAARRVAGSGPRATVAPASRLRRGLVIAQVGAALALVFVTSLCLRSVAVALGGIDEVATRTAFVGVDGARTATWLEQITRLPEIESAAIASFVPQAGQIRYGQPEDAAAALRTADGGRVSPTWFSTIGAQVIAGQWPQADTDGIVITDGVASRIAPSPAEAIGRSLRIKEGDDERVRTIAAVLVLPYRGPGGRSPQALYVVSAGPWPEVATAVVRGRETAPSARVVQQAFVNAGQADAPVQVTTLASLLEGGLVDVRLLGSTFSVLGAGALLLSTSGVLALLLVLVRTRRREFAIRAALGASGPALVMVIGREVSRLLVRGAVAGVFLGAGGVALLRSQIANTSPVDPVAIAATVLVLMITTGAAALVPAMRASRIPPAEALRG